MISSKDRYVFKSLANPVLECTIISDVRKNDTNKIVAEAVFQKCDDSNANGHKFPKRVLMAAVNEVADEVENRHLVGELDHPDDINDVNRIATISLKNISHVITKLAMDGNYVVGRFETIDTPNGNILATLLREKLKVGVSIRAITDQDISYGLDNVDTINEFTLITYDAVHNPAYSDAYVKSIVSSCYKLPNNNYRIPENVNSDRLITVTASELQDIIESVIQGMARKFKK